MTECTASHRHDKVLRCAHYDGRTVELYYDGQYLIAYRYHDQSGGAVGVPLATPLDVYWEHCCATWLRGENPPMPARGYKPARLEELRVRQFPEQAT